MTRKLSLIVMLIVLGCAAGWAADNPVVGTWSCTSVDDAGQSATWTMVVKEASGGLTGTLSGDPGEFTMVDPKLDGSTFTFKVVVNEVSYSVEATINGDKLDGKYKGAESNGTLKGNKQS
jgi:hypothetical protein